MNNINIQKLCRVCLEDGLVEIFDNRGYPAPRSIEDLSKKLEFVTSHNVLPNDSYPKMLCKKCIIKLNIASDFIDEFKLSEEKVSRYLTRLGDAEHSFKSEPGELDEYFHNIEYADGDNYNLEEIDNTENIKIADVYSETHSTNAVPQTVFHMSLNSIEKILHSESGNELASPLQSRPPSGIVESTDMASNTKNNIAVADLTKVDCANVYNDDINIAEIFARTENLVVCLDGNNFLNKNESLINSTPKLSGVAGAKCTNREVANRLVKFNDENKTLQVEIPLVDNSAEKNDLNNISNVTDIRKLRSRIKVKSVSNNKEHPRAPKKKKSEKLQRAINKQIKVNKGTNRKLKQEASSNSTGIISTTVNTVPANSLFQKSNDGSPTKVSPSNKPLSFFKIRLKTQTIKSKKQKMKMLRKQLKKERILKDVLNCQPNINTALLKQVNGQK